jgi:predicted MFS family arabinose efflux permease
VVAAFTFPYGLAQLVLGPLGDRLGKLRVLLGGLVAYAAAIGSCALASNLNGLILARICAGATSAALIPVSMAYIADLVAYERRQVALSRFITGMVMATIIAGPIGGIFGEYVGWRGVFLLIAAGSLFIAVLLYRRLAGLPDQRGRIVFNPDNYVILAKRPSARRLLLATSADGALMIGCFPFLAPYLHERFGLSYAEVGLLLSCFGLGALVYARSAWWLVPRLGEARLVLLGGAAMVVALLAAVTTRRWESFIAVELLLGFGFTTFHSVMQARATELLPHARATAVSTFAFMLFMGQSLGALAMGVAIHTLGYRGGFAIDAILIGLLALLLFRLFGLPARAH